MKSTLKTFFQFGASALMIAMLTLAVSCKPATSFDLAAAKTEIEANNKHIAELLSKNDSVGIVTEGYTADAKFFIPNSPAVLGRANLQTVWGEVIKAGLTKIELTTTEVWGDQNAITEEGTYAFLDPKGEAIEKGKYIVLWKKEDGKWKIHRDCYNADSPAQAAN